LGDDARISVDRKIDRPTDRFLLLEIPRAALGELGPKIADWCERLGLILHDIQHGRPVVPRLRGARPWPEPEPPVVASLRGALEATPRFLIWRVYPGARTTR